MKPLSEILNQSKARARDLAAKAGNEAQETAASARGHVNAAYDSARDTAHDVSAHARVHFAKMSDQAQVALERGRAEAKVAGAKARSTWDRHPLTVVAGALAVGAVAGLLMPRRNAAADPVEPVEPVYPVVHNDEY